MRKFLIAIALQILALTQHSAAAVPAEEPPKPAQTEAQDAHQHGHAAHPTDSSKLSLNQGKRWPTDAALRQHMEALRATFAERLHRIHRHQLSADDRDALAQAIDREVKGMIADCRLTPEADAMLHLIIADLLKAGAGLQAEKKAQSSALDAIHALEQYGSYFDHPDWQALH